MTINYDKLSIFREISNIGSGNASTSLANMLNETVDIGIPNSDIIEIIDFTKSYNLPDELAVGTVLQLSGDMQGFIMITMKVESAFKLLSKLSGKEIICDKGDYEYICRELNPIAEICNILCGTYLTAISHMTNLTITPSIPYFTVDMIRAIMNLPISLYGLDFDSILCIETEFFTESYEIEGKYYFIPDLKSCKKLLSNLGFSI